MSFPDGFLWGTATAAHQVEGGNVYNDSWLLEHVPGIALRRALGRRLRPLPPLPRRHRADRRARVRRLPLLARVVAHRARGGRVLARRARSLPAHARDLPRARPDADAHVPPLHLAALDRRRRRLGGRAHGGALRPLLRARDAPSRRPRAVRVHAQRAEPRPAAARGLRHPPPARRRGLGRRGGGARDDARAARACSSTARARRATEVMRSAHRLAVEAIKGVRPETQAGVTLALSEWQAEPGGDETLAAAARSVRGRSSSRASRATSSACRTTPCTRVGPDGPVDFGPGGRAHADGLSLPARGARARDPARRRRHRAARLRDRERDRHRRRRAPLRLHRRARCAASRPAWPTGSTSAATSTGRSSTTSSGPSATGRRSGSSRSIARRRCAPRSRARATTARSRARTAARAHNPRVPSILDAIGNTPLVRLRQCTPANGAELWLKLDYLNPTGSMKDRMALAMVEGAERARPALARRHGRRVHGREHGTGPGSGLPREGLSRADRHRGLLHRGALPADARARSRARRRGRP